ncbi:protein transporter SEC24 [Marasmius fiardii PR-910]|nr:protein transporter SEC24 [Marasmius fiardii PR-910]
MKHIPQPPHTTGKGLSGLRPRIDPNQVPSPTESIEQDRETWKNQHFLTLPGKQPPFATTDFVAVDQGNSSPKFIRPTTHAFPSTSRLSTDCSIPLAAIVQPFADLDPREEPVPVIETGQTGPARCEGCRAYVNPWVAWVAGGNRWKCNLLSPEYFSHLDGSGTRTDLLQRPELCKGTVDFDVSDVEEYWASDPTPSIEPLFASVSLDDAPPSTPFTPSFTSFGPKSFASSHARTPSTPNATSNAKSGAGKRKPTNPDYLFLIDVSEDAGRAWLAFVCHILLGVLYGTGAESGGEEHGCFPSGSRVAVVTFDSEAVQFWDLQSLSTPPRMIVMADLEQVFVPFPPEKADDPPPQAHHSTDLNQPEPESEPDRAIRRPGMFVNPASPDARQTITSLLEGLPKWFATHTPPPPMPGGAVALATSPLNAALRACLASLAGRGGVVVVFQAAPPVLGVGVAPPHEQDLFDTEKEKQLYAPQDPEGKWKSLAEGCVEEGVGVTCFLGFGRWGGIGTVGLVPSLTGGDMFFHPRFEEARDGPVLKSQLRRVLTRTMGVGCSAVVRCSRGLQVSEYLGNFTQTISSPGIECGILHADSAFGVSFRHTGALSTREYAHFQVAVLYTTAMVRPQRRVRVCNLAVQVVELAGNVFVFADVDAVVGWVARKAISNMSTTKMSLLRDDLSENCAAILFGYRKNCAAATRSTQLIIPEGFKSLPVYTLALLKSKPLKARAMSSDVKNYHARRMMSMSARSMIEFIYPLLLAIHDLDDTIALPVPPPPSEGPASAQLVLTLPLPAIMRSTHMEMVANGVYLIDNGETSILWIGNSVSPQVLLDLLGVDDVFSVDPGTVSLPTLPTRLSTQIRNILTDRQIRRGGRATKFYLCRQNLDAAEVEFSDMLVEDQNNGTMGYLDYLTVIHKQIAHVLTEGGSLSSIGTPMRSPW